MSDPVDEDFIDRIYDAATQTELWDDILTTLSDMMQSAGGAAFGMLANGQGSAFCHYGRYHPPEHHRLSGRHMINPWTIAVQHHPVGEVLPSHEILPLRDLRRTEFYADILAPEKLDHCVIASVSRDQHVNFAFNIMRGDKVGPYAEAEIAKLQHLMPHLRRSAKMRLTLGAYHALHQQQQELLDRILTGIILVDEIGQFRCANKAAEEIVKVENGLVLLSNSLSARDVRVSRRLSELVGATAAGGSGGSLSVPRSGAREPLYILVCPLRGMVRDALSAPRKTRQTVALFIKAPSSTYAELDRVLARLFELTRAEIRVALALAQGDGVRLVASRLQLSENTVKTHARHIYEKMGVSNQAELVQIVSLLASF